MKKFKNRGRINRATNAIDGATTTSASWGFKPVPCMGGKTTNAEIPESAFKRDLSEMGRK